MFGDNKFIKKIQAWRRNLRRCEFWKNCEQYSKHSYTCLNANSIFGDAAVISYCGKKRTLESGAVKHGQK